MKDEIRQKLKVLRAGFCGQARDDADEKIFKNFMGSFGGYERYFIYNSFPSEADTSKIISALESTGKKVFLPRAEGENMVAVLSGKTVKGAFGIFEPIGQAAKEVAEITVIPLIAVNRKGYRIGYGKGYYDRYLKDKNTIKVGLCYFFQIVDFNEDEWDIPLEYIVCEKGIYKIK